MLVAFVRTALGCRPWLASTAQPLEGGSDGSGSSFATNARASLWPWQRRCTTPQGQRFVRAGEEGHEEHDALRRQKPPPRQAFFRLYDEEDAEWVARPLSVTDPRPQERVQRHTMEHIVDFVCCSPMVQILDAPAPQMVEQLPDVLRFFDKFATLPEQAIEVPKFLPEDVPFRAVLRDPQLAEQLVEVPTSVSYSSLQRNMEQNVDIPVPGRGGRVSSLQGFLPGQGSTATRSSKKRISERIVEQIVDIPGGGLQDFRAGTLFFARSSSCL